MCRRPSARHCLCHITLWVKSLCKNRFSYKG
nr:MAG TPA: hypothetical protein [Caudoviricetes sp.]DAV65655.1 MAG TPA: hypothetical protein [Caudoviricetes sp.]